MMQISILTRFRDVMCPCILADDRLIHNSCFRDLSWPEAARKIWSPYSPSNCAATQLFLLIPLCHYASRKSQPLQTPFGPSFLPIPLDMFSMCWMGEPYSTEFHGCVGPQRIRTYAICLASIFQRSMGKLLWSSMDATQCLLRPSQ